MGRPPRPLVTKERIMRTALALVDDEGPEALSTTRIAARLGVKGPSLYNHISGRDEILDGISELIVAEMDLDLSIRPWTTALVTWARRYRAVLAAHPHAVPLFRTQPARSPSALHIYAEAFATLRAAGWPEDHLLVVVHSIESLIIGSLPVLTAPRHLPLPAEELPPGLGPLLDPPPGQQARTFELGLSALLHGFEDTLKRLNVELLVRQG
ncbi:MULTISPECIES: TetR/AcrR family transcriptional regulator [Kitasatospora]|uniref:TetR/AcrR family transcriptional regulator n=1 Tax=Kitasatospora TaxID=2063 RepID=UPI000C70199F|nr:TetR/AcrR family transcriptional regulator C-terminal domain-containing protein [Kitasatospora sp. GP30]MDH6139274.1 AcrR family transcriptional regulator [Kitasatospora sp. GP30]